MKRLFQLRLLLLAGTCLLISTGCDDDDDNGTNPNTRPTYPSTPVELMPRTSLATFGDVNVWHGGYGSGMALDLTSDEHFYIMTDRGPNFDGADGDSKVFPIPSFNPVIGRFKLENGEMNLVSSIVLKDASGTPITGLPNPVGAGGTGETPSDLDGNILPFDANGLDPEGIQFMNDGTFWVSDEYGPYMVHFNAGGTTIERLSPFSGGRRLPLVLQKRRPNRGMEGLTITPDESKIVGIMQSSLDNPSKSVRSTSKVTRIVVFDVATGTSKLFLYEQEAPALSNSEIRAISNTEFIVLERDGAFQDAGAVYKRLYKIDISNATDVLGDDTENGMMIDGKTLEESTRSEIEGAGINFVTKSLVFDILSISGGYPHDKPEGFVIINSTRIGIINDDDFGVDDNGNGGLVQKLLPGTTTTDSNKMYFVTLSTPLF